MRFMKLNVLTFENMPIFEQLKLEEALLRTNEENWCLLNKGSGAAIVLGASSKPEEFVALDRVRSKQIPIIQRFSGGGTVFVDEQTLFVTFIFQKKVHSFPVFPKPILDWTAKFYQKALELPGFSLEENDYTLNNKKVGGNAQYLRKDRWLHHTSFLWDYSPENMECLLMPKRQPAYRALRSHSDFLTTLKPHLTKEDFFQKILLALSKFYQIEFNPPLPAFPPHRQSLLLH